MNEFVKAIKTISKEYKIEIFLMAAFICLFLILNGPTIARQYIPVSGEVTGDTVESESMPGETETETDMESENWFEEESETVFVEDIADEEDMARENRRLLATLPEGFQLPMAMPEMTEQFHIFTLKDSQQLYGYHPLIPDDFIPVPKSDRSMETLEGTLSKMLDSYQGDWSLYLKNLNTNEMILIRDEPMKSASVMKLFIMGTVYRAIHDGSLERTEEVVNLLNNMISASDNESSNKLLYMLGDSSYEKGIEKVDRFIEEYGFSDMTREYNGFNNSETVLDSTHFNQVSAKDCGKILEDIYRRNWVSRAASNEIETMLMNQGTRYKIPAGLPEGVLCGNKTGEMDATENDAAIVYSEDCDYILVVLSSDWENKNEAISQIAGISKTVYEYLNGE